MSDLREQYRQRFTLPRHPSDYKRPVKCPACGSLNVVSVEAHRQRELAKRKTANGQCTCNAYPFPHERGSLRACAHHPDQSPLTSEEQRDYEAVTQRF